MPLSTLDQAPLKKALEPSSRAIFLQQSRVPLYMMSAKGGDKHSHKCVSPCFYHHSRKKMGNLNSNIGSLTSFASRLHHHTTTDGVEGVGNESGDRGHRLSNHPADNNVCVLGIWKHACKREKVSLSLKGKEPTEGRDT